MNKRQRNINDVIICLSNTTKNMLNDFVWLEKGVKNDRLFRFHSLQFIHSKWANKKVIRLANRYVLRRNLPELMCCMSEQMSAELMSEIDAPDSSLHSSSIPRQISEL